jgi:replicative DNA helicase
MEINQSSLPYSLDAEQTVLGTIILDASAISRVAAFLRSEHFHIELHNQLYSVMYSMFVNNIPIDLVTVIENTVIEQNFGEKQPKKVFDNQDEARGYLLKLAESVINPTSIADYANIIVEKHLMRSLMRACRDIYTMAAENTDRPKQIMDIAEKKIYELRSEREIGELVHIQPILKEKLDELEDACNNPDAKNARTLPSSFTMLDHHIFGLNPSDLILIAGRPGMGKTAFALNIAAGAAKLRPDKDIVIFSLEMSRLQLVTRLISTEARVDSKQMREGQIYNEDWTRIREGVEILSRLRMYFDDGTGVSIGEMKAKLRRVKNLGLIVIDYLQLMSTGRKDGNRSLEVGEITRGLKLMAKEFDVPIILASQLSRAASQRGKGEKRPLLTDLRDSGTIEQDADIVIFLHREGYHDNPEAANDPNFNPNKCECIIAKNRQGETGVVPLYWEAQFTKFSTLDYRHENNG